jgi:uncharacterized protein (DUF1697 family)
VSGAGRKSYVALLRGINVGGHKPVAMAELRKFLEALGLAEVGTLLQSGNVIFKSRLADAATVEAMLEKKTANHFGHAIDYFVRDAEAWRKMIAANPFRKEAGDDPSHLLVMFTKAAPTSEVTKTLKAAIEGREYFRAVGRDVFFVYPDGIGTSRLTGSMIEKKLGTRGTARNWNTVQKIAALLD